MTLPLAILAGAALFGAAIGLLTGYTWAGCFIGACAGAALWMINQGASP